VTMRTLPMRRKSSTVRNSSRPAVVVPLRFFARIVSHPAAFNAAYWIERYPPSQCVPSRDRRERGCPALRRGCPSGLRCREYLRVRG
jgi:hypothetical protein